MQDGDILYVANAEAVELSKFLTLVNGAVGTTSNAAVTYAAVK